MIEFDVKCRSCGKPITLRVRDDQSRVFFEKHGALCEACHAAAERVAPFRGVQCLA